MIKVYRLKRSFIICKIRKRGIVINILFIGCVESSKLLLEKLTTCHVNIVGVITKKESNFNSDFCDLTPICKENNIDIYYVNNINDEDSIDYIKSKNPDLIYCFGWSQLLSKTILDIPKLGVIGFHPAKLPANRGRHPIVWALVLGLTSTASTFFYINEGADDGDIISQVDIPIDAKDNARTLYDKILEVAVNQIEEFTNDFMQGTVNPIKQDNSKANYWRKRTNKDSEIDWRMSSNTIYNLIRALTKPYIGADFLYDGKCYKVWEASIIEDNNYDNIEYGKVIKVYDEKSFLIKTGDGLLKVLNCEPINLEEGVYLT